MNAGKIIKWRNEFCKKSGKSLRTNRGNPPSGNQMIFIFAYVELGQTVSSMRCKSGKETAQPRTRDRPRTERKPCTGRKEGAHLD